LLFPRAAAIVHHGGISTTALALRAGRPQLVVSVFADQPDNARRIARLGVGRWLKTKQCSAATIRTELSALLDAPWVAERAEAIGQIVSTENGPAEAVRVIEKIIVDAEGRRRG
jgi:UDP:flavonoid glycosyltransferase YjiC (YdhE family)